jgi:glycosyltransferase involved in cell wall biosynthesis
MPVGIGIVTYNRIDHLQRVVEAVERHTKRDYFLVVADDASTDDTAAYLREKDIARIGFVNRGVAWNKNRALRTLMTHTDADPILLLEDDTLPIVDGWEEQWIATLATYGYCTYGHPKMGPRMLAGSGTLEDPYACSGITSQCAGALRAALETVGYFETRFKGYGIADGEWTVRFRRAGFGMLSATDADGKIEKANVMISGGVETLDATSWRTEETVKANRDLYRRIRKEPIHRMPWHSDEDRVLLEREIKAGLTMQPLELSRAG